MRNLSPPLEVWAGPECTVNRVGECYHDQLRLTGHDARADDVERIADLGVKAVRYPVLWESHDADSIDWSWADDRLGRFRDLGIRPIVGLVHHGGGPPRTSLVDESFSLGLAEFAAKTAARFPWIEAYTPVNEPLTTARFSGLYGHWHPHGRDDASFCRCLMSECRAVVLAMREIRRVNSAAKLVQTEDLGQTHAVRALRYQADFENERRWLSWDLLCGKVDRTHPLRGYLRWSGVKDAELEWFQANACPPDILGVNHYVTSERFLDDRLERHPDVAPGSNGRHVYVDTEAVRAHAQGGVGLARLLEQIWKRYRRPIAITEAHLGCTPDEQVRWLWEIWSTAVAARGKGMQILSMTAWSIFGAFDWNSLVTRAEGCYEAGAYDVSVDPPRRTAVADFIADLAFGREPADPAIHEPGWWRRPDRFLVPVETSACGVA